MKNIINIIVICLVATVASAQKIIEKRISLSQGSSVRLNIQIADSIRIIAWDKNEAYVKATVDINDNQNNDDYKWTFDSTGNSFEVHSRFDFPKGRGCCGNSNDCNCNCNCRSNINLVVYVPANANLNVETINGNITITGRTAEVLAKSISGYVDMAVSPDSKADVKLSTITGTMYSDMNLNLDEKNAKRVGGSHIDTELNGGGKEIHLETISGDIYLRKA